MHNVRETAVRIECTSIKRVAASDSSCEFNGMLDVHLRVVLSKGPLSMSCHSHFLTVQYPIHVCHVVDSYQGCLIITLTV
jgi:hypothetical protein